MYSAGAAPKLVEDLSDATLLAAETATLSCRISAGDPAAELRWYRDGKEIHAGGARRLELTRDGDVAALTIASAEPADSAVYRCEAANKLGKVATEARLVVNSTCFAFTVTTTTTTAVGGVA